MSPWLPFKRATILVASGPSHDSDRKHLFILLTNPIAEPETGKKHVLMVSLSTAHEGIYHDPACILKPGEHPFVRRESYVNYFRTRIEDAEALLRGVKEGTLVPHEPVSEEVFLRVCEGLVFSKHAPLKVKKFYLESATK